MSKKKLTIIISILAGIILSVTALVSVSAYSEDDPLITLSYLEQVILPKFQAAADTAGTESVTVADTAAGTGTYTLVELSQGQTITADSICEFIARPGSYVTVISPHESQGIADMTNGTELYNGTQVPMNAYCIIPRGGDGRGIVVTSQKAFIMIRGDYTIG